MAKLDVPKGFLKEETRDGFTISEMMKRVWAVEIEVLSEIDSICKKHNIDYYLFYGTLLGAVRHKGFIPWDDDIDIVVKRKDYKKLLLILNEELAENYVVHSLYTMEEHAGPDAAVVNYKNVIFDKAVQERFYGCPYVSGVDIFPIDYLPRDKDLKEMVIKLYSAAYDLAHRFFRLSQREIDEDIPRLAELCNVKFNNETPLNIQLWNLADNIASMFTEDESDYLTYFPSNATKANGMDYGFRKETFDYTIKSDFEWLQFEIPCGYEELLENVYGKTYMIPINTGGGHGYPCYKEQEKYYYEVLEKLKSNQS